MLPSKKKITQCIEHLNGYPIRDRKTILIYDCQSAGLSSGEKSGQICKPTFNATRTAWVLDFSPTVADPCGQKQTFQVCMKLSWSGCTVSVMGQN